MRVTFFFAFLLSLSTYAQLASKVDSLEMLLKKAEGQEAKAHILEGLYDLTIYVQPEKSIQYAKEIFQMSKTGKNDTLKMKACRMLGANYDYLGNIDSSYFYHSQAKKIAELVKDEKTLALTLTDIANYHGLKGNFKESFSTYERAIELFKKVKAPINVGITIGALGSIHMDKGNYQIAQNKFMDALKVLDTLETEPYVEADILRRIGFVQYSLKNYAESIPYYEQALQVYLDTEDNVFASEAYIDIGASYQEMGQNELAIQHFENGLALAKEFNLEGTAAIASSNLGDAHTKIKNYEVAYDYLTKSLNYHDKKGFINNKIGILEKMANFHFAQNQPDKGLSYAQRAVKIADSVRSIESQASTYLLRSKIYENLANAPLALQDRKMHERYKDSIYNLKKTQQIEELNTIYKTEKKEAEIALQKEEINTLNAEAQVAKLTRKLYAFGMISFIIISGLLFFGFRQRIKKNRIAREKQEEIYKQKIEHKHKELTTQTLHLVQKNTFLQELMTDLEQLKKSPEKFGTALRRIIQLLKKENASDKDWETFKTYFVEVHNDFDHKLKARYKDISEKEMRLATFLRMKLTTKEIAATLNIMPDSIKKSKYRLKKKLGLDKETDLTSFLMAL